MKHTAMKHTATPWRFIEEDVSIHDGEYTEGRVVSDADEDTGIAKCVAVIRCGLEGTNANGRLIAAAPDLLAACHAFCSTLAFTPSSIAGAIERDLKTAYDMARLAIKKTEEP